MDRFRFLDGDHLDFLGALGDFDKWEILGEFRFLEARCFMMNIRTLDNFRFWLISLAGIVPESGIFEVTMAGLSKAAGFYRVALFYARRAHLYIVW